MEKCLRKRQDIHTISASPETWQTYQFLARKSDRTVSSYLRHLARKELEKERRKELIQTR